MKTLKLLLSFVLIAFFGISTATAQNTVTQTKKSKDIVLADKTEIKKDVQPYVLTVDPVIHTKFIITRLKEDQAHTGINLFPNPVRDLLHLNLQRAKNIDLSEVTYILENAKGEEVLAQGVSKLVENIDMTKFEESQYKIKVFAGDQMVKSYKVSIQ